MTDDMHREAFEKWFAEFFPISNRQANEGDRYAMSSRDMAANGWAASMRYRDELEKEKQG